MLTSSFPLPSQVPEPVGALMLVACSCSALFQLVPTGQSACVVVSDSLGAPRGCEWGTRTLPADGSVPLGMCWDFWCLIFLLALFSPAALWVVLQNLPLQVPTAWLLHWAQHPGPPEAAHGCWCCGVGHGCCLLGWFGEAPPGHWDLCLCVPHTFPRSSCCCFVCTVLMLCSWVGLLSSFQAFGFGVYCFSFLPTLHKQTQPLAASPMPALRVC